MSILSGIVVPGDVLVDVKNHLDITWNDANEDKKIQGFISSGMAYLDGKLGAKGDYRIAGSPRTLLFEYVRYARDGAMDLFESNYRHLILAMQTERQVQDYGKAVSNQTG